MQRKKKVKNYSRSKKAFDSVFSHYRSLSTTTSIPAVNAAAGGKPSRNPAKPTPLDFKVDVDRVVNIVVPEKTRRRFYVAYGGRWTDDQLEVEKLADKLLGGVRHSYEQRLGDQFIKRGLFPVQGHGYFWSVRGKRDNKAGS
jgi:hypothetical protein